MMRLKISTAAYKKRMLPAAFALAFMLAAAACGGRGDQETAGSEIQAEEEAMTEETSVSEADANEVQEKERSAGSGEGSSEADAETEAEQRIEYEGTLSAGEAKGDESPYYGIMHATVISINGKQGDSSTIYTFSDKKDPDNGWSFSGLEIRDIEAELETGADVCVLFSGDITGDGENVEFIAVLPDGEYTMRRIEGETVSNLMSTFTVLTDGGEEITFLKDNCMVDENALSSDSGDHVIVYYADGGELGNFPARVFMGN
jgi:hypothetical protein